MSQPFDSIAERHNSAMPRVFGRCFLPTEAPVHPHRQAVRWQEPLDRGGRIGTSGSNDAEDPLK